MPDPPRHREFDSRPRGALTGVWLGVVTMTTLGYGDVAPRSMCGKLLTSLCVIIGLVMLGLMGGTLITVVTEVDSLRSDVRIVGGRRFHEIVVRPRRISAPTFIR